MPDAVPALSVRLVLNTLREISGPQYERLVTQAGLGRFLTNPPADSWAPAATEAEINHMFGVAYQMLGDKGIRLFFRNYSQRLVPLILQSDLMRAKVAEVRSGAIPADRQLAWFVEAMSELANQGWSPVTTSEDRDAYYIEYLNCPLCAEIHNAATPICVGNDVFYRLMAQEMINRRLDVQEVTCAATGDPYCKYRIPKR